ncbi:unnamed protein product [Cuscuta campestris]|uniref:Uncharacterized protein n=1 Tax=Cuscuta campestris TaxID=132261 RepID=A0A484KHT8_9ASTE|nr:unnamed protein product [Cuscuta campestris]
MEMQRWYNMPQSPPLHHQCAAGRRNSTYGVPSSRFSLASVIVASLDSSVSMEPALMLAVKNSLESARVDLDQDGEQDKEAMSEFNFLV